MTGYEQAHVAALLGGNGWLCTVLPAFDALRAEYVGLRRRRMIEGTWVIAEGAVYDMFDEQRHAVDELPPMRRYWVGIDYGNANQFAAILYGLGADDQLYAVNEWRPNS